MIFVTGATGHIGNALMRKLLSRGEKVRALIMKEEDTSSIRDLRLGCIEGDVLDPASLQPAVDGVIPSTTWRGSFPSCRRKTRSCGRSTWKGRAT
jgi:uncharacterized protein YbjT (DUF2867 family)